MGGEPLQTALLIGQPAVEHGQRLMREAGGNAGLELRREIDLRHEHQDLRGGVGGQQARHGVQVDLGFAAAGDAV
ncbi:hypothetical protein D3C86_1344180 [compost metagenome]